MRACCAVLFLLALAPYAKAQDVGPWKFGMSADEIRAQASFGPYKSFLNGDLETYGGVFAGAKRNFQFYLNDGKLRRIAIRMYEGYDLGLATVAWGETYSALKAKFGDLETPKISLGSLDEMAKEARALVEAGGKAQMAPLKQPDGQFVFSTFAGGAPPTGGTLYMVTVNVDRPRDP